MPGAQAYSKNLGILGDALSLGFDGYKTVTSGVDALTAQYGAYTCKNCTAAQQQSATATAIKAKGEYIVQSTNLQVDGASLAIGKSSPVGTAAVFGASLGEWVSGYDIGITLGQAKASSVMLNDMKKAGLYSGPTYSTLIARELAKEKDYMGLDAFAGASSRLLLSATGQNTEPYSAKDKWRDRGIVAVNSNPILASMWDVLVEPVLALKPPVSSQQPKVLCGRGGCLPNPNYKPPASPVPTLTPAQLAQAQKDDRPRFPATTTTTANAASTQNADAARYTAMAKYYATQNTTAAPHPQTASVIRAEGGGGYVPPAPAKVPAPPVVAPVASRPVIRAEGGGGYVAPAPAKVTPPPAPAPVASRPVIRAEGGGSYVPPAPAKVSPPPAAAPVASRPVMRAEGGGGYVPPSPPKVAPPSPPKVVSAPRPAPTMGRR